MANSRELTPALATAVTAKTVYPVILYKMETAVGPVYFWSGLGDLVWNGMTFTGAGNLAAIDVIPETIDQTANSVRVSLAGIPSNLLYIALDAIEQRYKATLWFGAMTAAGTLVVDPYQIFQGITDVPEIEEGADTCRITITLESNWADLNRAKTSYYTPEDQKLIDPTDKGFDFVAGLQNATVTFA